MQEFKARLKNQSGGSGTMTYFVVPFNVEEKFGSKSMVKVKVSINGHVHRGLIMPDGKGKHYMGLRKSILDEVGKKAGEEILVKMEVDTEERIIVIPDDFNKILNKKKQVKEFFDELSYTNRKEYVDWITSSKKEETRKTRIDKAFEMLLSKEKHP
jgi:hypothetical protein